jgi:signal transduction histidine kinase
VPGAGEGAGTGASVWNLYLDRGHTLWAATQRGLVRISQGRTATLTSKAGLPCDAVHWVTEDDAQSFWVGLACGVARVDRAELAAWSADPTRKVRVQTFGREDGVINGAVAYGGEPRVAKARDGKLYFHSSDGVGVIDPLHLPVNKLPPPVHVEEVVADRVNYTGESRLRFPPLVRDLEIHYTALSLVAPEKVSFKYKLEGRDKDWQETDRRRAYYTDLPPGDYRFRVIAANNSGVWNEQGDALDFTIPPAWWQTNWFRALCVTALALLFYIVYRLRVAQIARHFNATLDARVNERTRIARELHDTLLQSFHGLLLRFQMALELMPSRPDDATKILASTIDQAADAITEGRDAVQGLRTSATEGNDLADGIRSFGKELADDSGDDAPELRVDVQGTSRALHPIVRDEIFRIASEALRNAFRHANAKHIEVELRYDDREMRLRVRDDGRGIDQKVLTEGGREGHFGLRGMRERATVIGGKLTVWSGLDAGTEVELSVPGSRGYASPAGTQRSGLLDRFTRPKTTTSD